MLAPLGVERNRGGWRVATEVGEAAYLYFRIPDSVWLVQFFEFVGTLVHYQYKLAWPCLGITAFFLHTLIFAPFGLNF